MPTLASGICYRPPYELVRGLGVEGAAIADAPEVCYRVGLQPHKIAGDGNSRAPNKSWYRNAVGNQAEESEVGLRGWAMGWLWFTTE